MNHFNEFVMLLELLGDMPDLLEQVREWAPKTYREHFEQSHFSDRELAIEAYELAPQQYRLRFDDTVDRINTRIANLMADIDGADEMGDMGRLGQLALDGSQSIRELMDVASAIINGFNHMTSQSEIDALLKG